MISRCSKVKSFLIIVGLLLGLSIASGLALAGGPVEPGTNGENNASASFTDVPVSHWAYGDIAYMVDKGYVKGYPGGVFMPDQLVTRAELSVMIAEILGLTGNTQNKYIDLNPQEWYYEYVASVVSAGIIRGVDAWHFRPSSPLTREEMAVVLFNMLRYKNLQTKIDQPEQYLSQFVDSESLEWYDQQAVALSVKTGLISGEKQDGLLFLAPGQYLTRAQEMVILHRFIVYVDDKSEVSNSK